jgi:uncharacterized repeat protein (TIGR01451 family)
VIELWANAFNGVRARAGSQFAELNAFNSASLYQNVCINPGETISWALSHRGRDVVEEMRFVVSDSLAGLSPANIVATAGIGGILNARTGTTGNGTAISCQSGSAMIAPFTACSVTPATVGTTQWVDYAGSFTWNGAAGNKFIGFASITAGSAGNFLDAITVTLKPYIELSSPASSGPESSALPAGLGLYILGNVPATFTVPVTVSGGTATLGTDFTTTSGAATFNVTIPAGNYALRTLIPLGIIIINDTLIENNETINFTIAPSQPTDAYVVASSATCGSTANLTTTYTIVDDDVDLSVTKTASPTAPINYGAALTYTVTYQNTTPSVLTVAPLTAHDASAVLITDPVPAGATFVSWTCVATSTTCPAASGTGAISATANLPVGARLVYTINTTAPAGASACPPTGSLVNTATIASTATAPASNPLTEGTSVQGNAAYAFQPNTANATVGLIGCANIQISKTDNQTTVISGQALTYNIVVNNQGPAAADGASVSDPAVAGLNCTAVTCTGTGGAVCPSAPISIAAFQNAPGVAVPTLPSGGTATFALSCTVQ